MQSIIWLHIINLQPRTPTLPYSSGEQMEDTVCVEETCRVVPGGEGVQGPGQHQEQPVDQEQQQVEQHQHPEEQEVGEHRRPEAARQELELRPPQPHGAHEGQSTQEKTPCLSGSRVDGETHW